LAAAPKIGIRTACFWLSIAIVLGHALVPLGSPVEGRDGSAFSSSSYEVSLAPIRAAAKIERGDAGNGAPAGLDGDAPHLFLPPAPADIPPVRIGADPAPIPAAAPAPISRPGERYRARAPPRA